AGCDPRGSARRLHAGGGRAPSGPRSGRLPARSRRLRGAHRPGAARASRAGLRSGRAARASARRPVRAAPRRPPAVAGAPARAPTLRREVGGVLMERLGRWLDRLGATEEPPTGLDAELLAALEGDSAPPLPDQHALWSALTALSQEVRLQGRAFQALEVQLRDA